MNDNVTPLRTDDNQKVIKSIQEISPIIESLLAIAITKDGKIVMSFNSTKADFCMMSVALQDFATQQLKSCSNHPNAG